MSDKINFDLIEFEKNNYKEWIKRYRGCIRVSIVWKKIKNKTIKTELIIANEKTSIFIPKYSDGDWRDGKPKKWSLGSKLCLIRVPAIKRNNHYFILDGCHRLTQKKPNIVLIDSIEPSEKDLVYFTDFFNKELDELTKENANEQH